MVRMCEPTCSLETMLYSLCSEMWAVPFFKSSPESFAVIAFSSSRICISVSDPAARCEHLLHSREVLLFHYMKLFAFYRGSFSIGQQDKSDPASKYSKLLTSSLKYVN